MACWSRVRSGLDGRPGDWFGLVCWRMDGRRLRLSTGWLVLVRVLRVELFAFRFCARRDGVGLRQGRGLTEPGLGPDSARIDAAWMVRPSTSPDSPLCYPARLRGETFFSLPLAFRA